MYHYTIGTKTSIPRANPPFRTAAADFLPLRPVLSPLLFRASAAAGLGILTSGRVPSVYTEMAKCETASPGHRYIRRNTGR